MRFAHVGWGWGVTDTLHWKLTLGRKPLVVPGHRTCVSGVTVRCRNQLSCIPSFLCILRAFKAWGSNDKNFQLPCTKDINTEQRNYRPYWCRVLFLPCRKRSNRASVAYSIVIIFVWIIENKHLSIWHVSWPMSLNEQLSRTMVWASLPAVWVTLPFNKSGEKAWDSPTQLNSFK